MRQGSMQNKVIRMHAAVVRDRRGRAAIRGLPVPKRR